MVLRKRSSALVVEVDFAFARDGNAIALGGGIAPLLNGSDDDLVDGWAEAFEKFQLGNFSLFVDYGVEDDVAFCAVRHGGQVRFGIGKVGFEGDGDIPVAKTALGGIADPELGLGRRRLLDFSRSRLGLGIGRVYFLFNFGQANVALRGARAAGAVPGEDGEADAGAGNAHGNSLRRVANGGGEQE